MSDPTIYILEQTSLNDLFDVNIIAVLLQLPVCTMTANITGVNVTAATTITIITPINTYMNNTIVTTINITYGTNTTVICATDTTTYVLFNNIQ